MTDQPSAADRRRIDVHHHIAPPEYLAEVGSAVNAPLRHWSLAKSIEDMDEGGVATAIVSVTQIAMRLDDRDRVRRLARACNDYAARMVADHRGRFGMFTALPMPDIEGSLREIDHALDTLKADGVALMTNIGDKWLGDAHYAPVFEELNRRGAVVYTHPVAPDCCRDMLPEFNDSVIEYGADTSRAIGKLLYSGSAARYPRIRFIFSHAGGSLPYSAFRFIRHYNNASAEVKAKMPDGFVGGLNKFFYDTANTSNVYAMASFSKLIALSQLMFGTDFPFGRAAHDAAALAECGFSAADIRAIECENAHRLWPRLKPG